MNSENTNNITGEQQQFIVDNSIPKDLLPSLSMVFAVLMAFLCVAGTVTNTLSLIIFAKASSRRRSINVLLCGLSASDLCLCILALPVFSLAQLQQFIPGLPPSLANHLLVFCYPLCLMAQTMSVWMLVGITIDRWLAVCYPFSIRIHCTVKRARLIVLGTFLFSLFYNLVRFWEYRIDSNGEIVGLLRDDYLFMLLYQNLATTLSQFLLPLCVLCPLNLQVARSILAARERRKNMLWTELSSVEASSREQSTAAMMLVVVLGAATCGLCNDGGGLLGMPLLLSLLGFNGLTGNIGNPIASRNADNPPPPPSPNAIRAGAPPIREESGDDENNETTAENNFNNISIQNSFPNFTPLSNNRRDSNNPTKNNNNNIQPLNFAIPPGLQILDHQKIREKLIQLGVIRGGFN
ncbi:hypothetical protein ACQ4LE_003393 [Meloidogyne hapla]